MVPWNHPWGVHVQNLESVHLGWNLEILGLRSPPAILLHLVHFEKGWAGDDISCHTQIPLPDPKLSQGCFGHMITANHVSTFVYRMKSKLPEARPQVTPRTALPTLSPAS